MRCLQITRFVHRFAPLIRVAHAVDHDRVLDLFSLTRNLRRCTPSFVRLLSCLQSASVMRVLSWGICVRMLEDHGGVLEHEHLYKEFKSA